MFKSTSLNENKESSRNLRRSAIHVASEGRFFNNNLKLIEYTDLLERGIIMRENKKRG